MRQTNAVRLRRNRLLRPFVPVVAVVSNLALDARRRSVSGLQHLLEQAHPVVTLEDSPNLRLAELAPDMARLLIDMAAWVKHVDHRAISDQEPDYEVMDSLLARFAELDRRAAQ